MEWIRVVNVALAALVVMVLIAGAIRHWHQFTPRLQRITPWVVATYVVLAYGSGEAAKQGTPPGIRVALTACVLMGLLIALTYRFTDDD